MTTRESVTAELEAAIVLSRLQRDIASLTRTVVIQGVALICVAGAVMALALR